MVHLLGAETDAHSTAFVEHAQNHVTYCLTSVLSMRNP